VTRPHWTLLATVFAAQAVGVGVTFGAFTVFVDPIVDEFASSRGVVSAGIGLMALMIGVMGPVWGPWIDAGAFRRMMVGGAATLSASLLAASFAPSLPVLAFLCALAGTVAPLMGPLIGSSLIGKVFVEARGRALGVASMGPPAGTFLFAMLGGEWIVEFGWRTALRGFGVVAGLLVPVLFFVIPRQVPRSIVASEQARWTRARLLRARSFLTGAVAMGIAAGLSLGWGSQVVPFVSDLGHGFEASALVAAVGGGTGIVGTLLFGFLADRWSARWLFLTVIVLQAASFCIFLSTPPYPVLLAVAALSGICGGSFATLYAMLLTERFGAAELGQTLGLTNVFVLPFASLSPVLAGTLRDSSGSYALPLLVLAGGMLLAACALLVPPPRAINPAAEG